MLRNVARRWFTPFALGCCAALAAAGRGGLAAEPVGRPQPAPLEWEHPPAPIAPVTPRSEADRDRIESAALYAHGRILYQRGEYSAALRNYQRAYRYSPHASPVSREIVSLAIRLRREDEASRFAVLTAEHAPVEPAILRRLADSLADRDEPARALRLYEKAIRAESEAMPGAGSILARREMGRLYLLTGRYDRAASALAIPRDALAQPAKYGLSETAYEAILGEPAATYGMMGRAFLAAKRFEPATEMFQKADATGADDAVAAWNRARVAAGQHDDGKTLAQLQTYFDARADVAGLEPYALLERLIRRTQPDRARADEQLLDRLVAMQEHDPTNRPLARYLARLYHRLGKLDRAAATYGRLLEAGPTLDAYRGLIDVYYDAGDVQRLLDVLARALWRTNGLEPLGRPAARVAADAEMLGKLIDAAKARRSDGKEAQTRIALAGGLLCIAAGRFNEADRLFAAAADTGPQKAEVMLAWGLEMLLAGQYASAERVFRRAIDEQVMPENNAAFHYYLAGILEMLDRTDEAVVAADKAIALRRRSAPYLQRKGWVLYHAGRLEQARETYRSLIEQFDGDHSTPEVRRSVRDARLMLANIAVARRRVDRAVEWLEQVLDEFPEDAGALNDLAYLWAERNVRLERARRMAASAVRLEPENVSYRDTLGWVLYRQGQFDRAAEQLQAAAVGPETAGVILDHLGDAYWKLGKIDQARSAWKKALDTFDKEQENDRIEATEHKLRRSRAE